MRTLAIALLVCAWPMGANGQQVDPLQRFTVAGGLAWLGGYPLGASSADIRSNATRTVTPPSFTLFRAESEFRPAAGAHVQIGIAAMRNLFVEVGGGYAQPMIQVSLSQDAEAEAVTLDADRIRQYEVDVSARYVLPWHVGNRMQLHALGGVGYLRELHEDRTLAETGRLLHAGGGAQWWLSGDAGSARAFGLRAELLAVARSQGIDFEDRTRVFPVARVMASVGCQKMFCR